MLTSANQDEKQRRFSILSAYQNGKNEKEVVGELRRQDRIKRNVHSTVDVKKEVAFWYRRLRKGEMEMGLGTTLKNMMKNGLKKCKYWHDVPEPVDLQISQRFMCENVRAYLRNLDHLRDKRSCLESPHRRRILMSIGVFYKMDHNQVMSWFDKIVGGRDKNPVEAEEVEYCMRTFRAGQVVDFQATWERMKERGADDRSRNEHKPIPNMKNAQCREDILSCYHFVVTPEGTMNYLRNLNRLQDGDVPITEDVIKFWYDRFEIGNKNLEPEKTLDVLRREALGQEEGEKEEYEYDADIVAQLHSVLVSSRRKIIDQLEIHSSLLETFFSVQMDDFSDCASYQKTDNGCYITRSKHRTGFLAHDEKDHLKMAAMDILTFLEFCDEHQVMIRCLTLTISENRESEEFLSMLMGHEVLGKIDVETFHVVDEGRDATIALEVAKSVRCEILRISDSGFEYGRIEEFVEALRNCNPELDLCVIQTSGEIPHFFHFWEKVEDFEVTVEANMLTLER